ALLMTPKKHKRILIAWIVLGIVAAVIWVLFVFVGWDSSSSTGMSNAVKSLAVYFLPEIIVFLIFALLWIFLSRRHPKAQLAFIIILSVLSAWHLLETLTYILWWSADGFNTASLFPVAVFLEFLAWVILLAILNNDMRRSGKQA
ncbi:MAG: SurA N-terminal domain-containing protein, partial [Clostridia bacterium]|nr:SurA N-terminal domain-containing protein [Clostridia bacterium]